MNELRYQNEKNHCAEKIMSPYHAVADSPVVSESVMIATPEIIGGSFSNAFL